MSCNQRNDERIRDLLSGSINPIRGAILRAHLKRCATCRSEWERGRELWSSLAGLASEPAGAELKARIAQSLPPAQRSVRPITWKEALAMKKRLVVVVALLLVCAAGLLASGLLGGKATGEAMVNGHSWAFTSSFQGRMSILTPDGDVCAMTGPLGGDQTQGSVSVKVDGESYLFDGIGRHEVRGKSGELLGYVEMRQVTQEEVEADAAQASAGVQDGKNGVTGFDKTLGITWEMVGPGRVTVEPADGVKAGMQKGVGDSGCRDLSKQPVLTVHAPWGDTKLGGYGRFSVSGKDGNPMLIFTIERPKQSGR